MSQRPSGQPVLLTIGSLLRPVEETRARLKDIEVECQRLPDVREDGPVSYDYAIEAIPFGEELHRPNVGRMGLFVLAIGSLEVMVQDILLKILWHFPEKISEKQLRVEELLTSPLTSDVLETRADLAVREIMYGTLQGMIKQIKDKVGIDLGKLDASDLDCLQEMKETRNLLLHNDLRPNEIYRKNSGELARGPWRGRLTLNAEYTANCIAVLQRVADVCESQLRQKYGKYTKREAYQRLWNYLVLRPDLTPFEQFFEAVTPEGALRPLELESGDLEQLGSAERVFYEMFKDLFCLQRGFDEHFTFRGLDYHSQRKISVLMAAFHTLDPRRL